MKILIASTIVPFIEGGGTFIVDWLEQKLKEYGHECEVLKIPFYSYYAEMPEQMLALRLLDLGENVDRLIAIRTPSYLISHPDKYLWFIHHHRGAYDLWGTKYQDIPNTPEGLKIRDTFIKADDQAFREAKKIFTNSKVVSDRLKRFNQVDSQVLYPPLMNPENYHCGEFGDYIFYASRIAHHKRQFLAAEAMRYTKTNVKLVIAGQPDSEQNLNDVISTIKKYNLENKVKVISRWISEEEKIKLFADSLGAVYMPYDEDSYGYPSLEAYHSQKAVITCSDSGGTLEVVEDGVNGFVTASDPIQLAEAFDKLYLNKALAKKMGQSGFEKISAMNITWDNVIRRFTT